MAATLRCIVSCNAQLKKIIVQIKCLQILAVVAMNVLFKLLHNLTKMYLYIYFLQTTKRAVIVPGILRQHATTGWETFDFVKFFLNFGESVLSN
jgi:hypothetical protein